MVSAILFIHMVTPELIYMHIYILDSKYPSSSTFTNIYAIPLGLWPLYVPCLIEQSLIMLLTAMKYVYDKEEAKKSLILKEGGPTQCHSILSTTIKASEEDVADVEEAT